MTLLTLAEAQDRLLAMAVPLPVERVPVAEALGRYLAEPLVARRTQPPADLSAMDGYALRAADLPGSWRVIGESACGHPFSGTVGPGEAVRIATGALVPDGADMVLIQEDAARDGAALTLTGTPPDPTNKHIRRKGMDFAQGAPLLPAHRLIPRTSISAARAWILRKAHRCSRQAPGSARRIWLWCWVPGTDWSLCGGCPGSW